MTSSIEELVINIEHDIDEQYQYSPSELMRGKIVLKTRRALILSHITIYIKGEGVVAWENREYKKSFNANEVYINATKQLSETINQRIDKGEHTFTFEYELPDNLPSSYIGKYGSVTYVLKATAVGEHITDTMITSEPFLVLRNTVLPLNSNRKLNVETKKKLRNHCLGSGIVRVSASVQKIGLLPGEDMYIDAEIKNKTSHTITAVEAALIMETKYHADKIINHYKQIINRRRDEIELMKDEGRRWQDVRLAIPPYIPESKLEYCDIIDVNYVFQLKVETETNASIFLHIPVIIASHENVQPRRESMINYDLHKSNSTWTDMTLRRKKLALDSNIQLSNGELNTVTESKWCGTTPPELRMDTTVENPLFKHDAFMNGKISNVEKQEIIESTKL